MITVQQLKDKFCVEENQQLAEALGCTAQAVSNWKRSGVPAIVERRALEILRERGMAPAAPTVNDPRPDYRGIDPLMVEAISVMKTWPRSKLARHVAELIAEAEDEAAGK